MAKKTSKATAKKEKVSVSIPLLQEEASTDQYLTREEQLNLEDSLNASAKARLELSLHEQVLVNKKLELLLKDREVKDAQLLVNTKDSEYKNRTQNTGILINSLREKYGVAGNFQYDPVSGKIVTE
jgi:hypothetical protein